MEKDELYDEAVIITREIDYISTSILQRRLRIGYARSACLIDELEENGVVGPSVGVAPRKVLPSVESNNMKKIEIEDVDKLNDMIENKEVMMADWKEDPNSVIEMFSEHLNKFGLEVEMINPEDGDTYFFRVVKK